MGHGGVKAIHELTGVSMTTIIQGKKELGQADGRDSSRVRKRGGGRKPVTEKYVDVKKEIEKIVEDETFGDPEAVLLWTTKSLRNIKEVLQGYGIEVSHVTIGNLLKELDYSLQLNQKMLQTGSPHPDRAAQFKYINAKSLEFIHEGQPVISWIRRKKNCREFQE